MVVSELKFIIFDLRDIQKYYLTRIAKEYNILSLNRY